MAKDVTTPQPDRLPRDVHADRTRVIIELRDNREQFGIHLVADSFRDGLTESRIGQMERKGGLNTKSSVLVKL